jgi:hypothetical protein
MDVPFTDRNMQWHALVKRHNAELDHLRDPYGRVAERSSIALRLLPLAGYCCDSAPCIPSAFPAGRG